MKSKDDLEYLTSELDMHGFFSSVKIKASELLRLFGVLGEVRTDKRNPQLFRDISPQNAEDALPNTLSSRFGTSGFPFHTDTAHWSKPARYLVLHCVSAGSGNRPTLLQDTRKWSLSPENVLALKSEVWKSAHARPFLCTIGEGEKNRLHFRYDLACMAPMTPGAARLPDLIESRIGATKAIRVEWTNGKTLIIDNKRMLHARGQSLRTDADRKIRRILVGE